MKKEEELQDLVRECLDTGVMDSEIFRRAKELGYTNNKRILETIIEGRRERIDVVKRFRGSNKKEEAKEENHVDVSPLLYAISICDEDLALKRIDKSSANDRMEYGLTALHMASEKGMTKIVRELLNSGARIDEQSTSDIRLHHTVVQSGGSTAMHFAAQKGHVDVLKLLLESGGDCSIRDFDESTAMEIAMLRDDKDAMDTLSKYHKVSIKDPVALAKWREIKNKKDREARTKRSRDAFVPLPSLEKPYKLKSIYSHKECERILQSVLRHTSEHGWTSQRHRGHASTIDIQCSEIETIDVWIRQTLRERLFPELSRRHEFKRDSFFFRDLFFVKYSASEGSKGQRGVGIHRDGSIVSFNVLLNSEHEFTGGGTYIEASNTVYTIDRGDCFVHSGKVRHGGETITSGVRYILVGFLDAKLCEDTTTHGVVVGDVSLELHTRSGR